MTPDPPETTAPPPVQSIDYRQLPWSSKLFRDYCHAFDRLEPFFTGSPLDPVVWQRAIRSRQARSGPHAEISAVTVAQLTARGAPPEAVASARSLTDPKTVAIVTGQQAGLFGGPLFTLLKALTAVKLARRVSVEHGVTAVPVFWVHAEDHDLDEISTCDVLTDDFTPHALTVPHDADSGLPASAMRLTDSITDVVAELRQVLPETEFSETVLEELTRAYRPGAGMVDAFSRWMDGLLGELGLVIFDGSDPDAKPLVRSVLARALEAPRETSALAVRSGTDLSTLGYHTQVTPSLDAAALFYSGGRRESIRLVPEGPSVDGMFQVGTETIAGDQLRARAADRPDLFSPNVLLRPVIQDAMFPTVGYVAGPSELAYLAQLRRVYDHFDIPMPVVYPRASATILDTATLRFLGRYDVEFERLQARDDAVLNRLLAALLPKAVERTLSDAEQATGERLAAVAAEVAAVDPTLVGAVETTQGRVNRDLQNLRNKIIQAAKRRDATLRRQFHRARSQAFPNGGLQERAVAGVYFLNRYGPHLVSRLLEDLPLEIGHHWLLTV